jgi:hypothetical protein
MRLRNSVFGSKSESEVFGKLQSQWEPNLTLYPQLPFATIVEIELADLSERERDYFYKTSIDYTFCLPDGRPLASIEFDGIGGGFSRDGEYIPSRRTEDPYRKLKLDFKLRLAQAVDYPLVVVSYDEARSLDEDGTLTILDGIVGRLMTMAEWRGLVGTWLAESRAELNQMPDYARDDYIQDLALSAEVEAEVRADPMARDASRYEWACVQHGERDFRVERLYEPPLPPPPANLFDAEQVRARGEAMLAAVRVGCRVVILHPGLMVARQVWLRNFSGSGLTAISVAENIARYLAFREACSKVRDTSTS